MGATRTEEASPQSNLSLPPSLATEHKGDLPLCCSSHPRAPPSLQDMSTLKPVSHFLSCPRGRRRLGQHHPGHFPMPLSLTQRNRIQEGNVCNAGGLDFSFHRLSLVASAAKHDKGLASSPGACAEIKGCLRVLGRSRQGVFAHRLPNQPRRDLKLATPVWRTPSAFSQPIAPEEPRRAGCRVRRAGRRRTHQQMPCLDRKDLRDHRVHLLASSFLGLTPEIPQTRRTCIPRTGPDYPSARAAPGLQPPSDCGKSDPGREGGRAPNLSRCSRN